MSEAMGNFDSKINENFLILLKYFQNILQSKNRDELIQTPKFKQLTDDITQFLAVNLILKAENSTSKQRILSKGENPFSKGGNRFLSPNKICPPDNKIKFDEFQKESIEEKDSIGDLFK